MPTLELPHLFPRGIAPFPEGSNATDTLINGLHYNLTALRHFNYTLYANNTISNNSKCYLAFDKYKPIFLSNGTWVNATTCYVPISGIGQRGKLGIAFATLFAVCLLFTLINLKKHGTQYLREDKRFKLVGRRWTWYWCIFVCTSGLIGTITSIDVDRDYLQDIAIILQSFFFYLMYPGTMAAVWEAVRHWGSWQERQIIDREPFALRQDDRRSRAEFYLPLIFYLFTWLNFFMTIPRPWTPIEKQRSPEQQAAIAEPAGTDTRFKAGSIIMVAAYATIVYTMRHNMHYYKPHESGIWASISNFCLHCPTKLFLVILVLAVRVAYGIASAWIWDMSVMKYDGAPAWPYGAGYAPSVLIMVILIVAGLVEENEDKSLIKQRQERGRATDAELGITRKPAWWRKGGDGGYISDDQRLRNLATEVGGGRATANRISQSIALGNMRSSRGPESPTQGVSTGTVPMVGLRDRSRSRPIDEDVGPFRDHSPASSDNAPMRPGLEHRRSSAVTDGTAGSGDTQMTGTTLNAPQQKVRSMLDV